MSTRKYLKCPWCDIHFKFDVRGKLGDHISSAHRIQKVEEKWMCPDCGDMRDNVKELIKHLAKIHNFGTMFHCQQCNYSSYIYKNFSAHSKEILQLLMKIFKISTFK